MHRQAFKGRSSIGERYAFSSKMLAIPNDDVILTSALEEERTHDTTVLEVP